MFSVCGGRAEVACDIIHINRGCGGDSSSGGDGCGGDGNGCGGGGSGVTWNIVYNVALHASGGGVGGNGDVLGNIVQTGAVHASSSRGRGGGGGRVGNIVQTGAVHGRLLFKIKPRPIQNSCRSHRLYADVASFDAQDGRQLVTCGCVKHSRFVISGCKVHIMKKNDSKNPNHKKFKYELIKI